MNQHEWKNSWKLGIKLNYTYYNKSHKLMKQFNEFNKLTNENLKTEVHHLRDTEEQRNYNDEHYELWGFNKDGTFEYGKYIIFVTKEEHTKIHSASEETKKKLSEASTRNWQNDDYRKKVTDANIGKKMPDSAKQTLREIHLGDKNHMYGKTHSESTKDKMRESHLIFWENNEALKNEYREKLSGENNAMYGKRGKDHPKYGTKLSDETKEKISKNNGIKKIHQLYLKYKSNGGTIGWHEFQKLPNDKRFELANSQSNS